WLIAGVQNALGGNSEMRLININNADFQLWNAPLRDQQGEVIGAMGVGTYFIEQDWKDDALVTSQRMIQTLLSNLPGMAYRIHHTPEWNMDFVSEGCTSLTGYYPSDLIEGHRISFKDLIHPDDHADIDSVIQEALETGMPFQLTYRIRTAGGVEKWVWELGRRVESREDGVRDVTEGFITDITERRHAEEALANEHSMLRTVIDNLPDYVFAKDLDGHFIVSNAANARYLRVSHPDDVIGKSDYDFFEPERADSFRTDELDIIESGKPMLNQEIEVYYEKSDSSRWYAITKAPLRNHQREITGVVGLIREITRHKEAETQMVKANQQLVELNELKSHFLLTMSHELRTPLNSVLGYTEMLLQEVLGELNEKQRDRLERVHRNGRELLAMIEDVLDISKIQTGKMEIHLEAVNTILLLEDCLPMFEAQAAEKNILLETDIEPDLPAIHADREAVAKIINNLLSNAVKFTHEGYVMIAVHQISASIVQGLPIETRDNQNTWIMMSVQDTGIGIPAELKQRIFDEFRQADGSTTRRHGGTGLGLALSHKLVELLNGYIWLESAPGYGTTFFVLLPAVN
ncbi:MAG TPA: ATP-binding protein, partial [Aggregatilineales bacterium]|nr:ATP-binding protein [Aggregatilineales bacterium]